MFSDWCHYCLFAVKYCLVTTTLSKLVNVDVDHIYGITLIVGYYIAYIFQIAFTTCNF